MLVVVVVVVIVILFVVFLLFEWLVDVWLCLYGELVDVLFVLDVMKENLFVVVFCMLLMVSCLCDFWLLFFSFFICGVSINGYVGMYLIVMCSDYGMIEV